MKLISFNNFGNTCYINSILQCFIYFCGNLPNLWEFPKIKESINFQENDENININFNLKYFLDYFFENYKQFKRFQQNDAHDFLMTFFEILLKQIPGYNGNLKINNPITKEYYGQTRLDISCLCCKKTKSVYEYFNTINLNVSENTSITNLFIKYLKKEIYSDPENLYYCDCCKKYVISEQKTTLTIIPRQLIIVLKRYTPYGNKLRCSVKYDSELYIKMDTILKYTLNGIINNSGNLYDGHYTSLVKINKNWYDFDDKNINCVESINYNNPDAYILFYTLK